MQDRCDALNVVAIKQRQYLRLLAEIVPSITVHLAKFNKCVISCTNSVVRCMYIYAAIGSFLVLRPENIHKPPRSSRIDITMTIFRRV